MRRLLPIVALLFAAACARPAPVDVIIDHDGDIDDLIAMSMIGRSPAFHVEAVTVTPADSYLEPALRATRLFLDQSGAAAVPVFGGHREGTNRFPDEWRRSAAAVLTIPVFARVPPPVAFPATLQDAPHALARLLSSGRKYVILETGPLTNVADALAINPAIRANITRIYVMGGAVRVKGNVEQPGHDGSAEWNVFNEPAAAAAVLASGVPVTLVPLDATNTAPLTEPFIDRIRAQPSPASQMAAQSWALVHAYVVSGEYYIWDTMTAAVMLDPSVVTMSTLRLRVVTTGVSQGRTVETPDGIPVEVALSARRDRVEQVILDALKR